MPDSSSKPDFNFKAPTFFVIVCAVFISLFSSFTISNPIKTEPIALPLQKRSITPKEFYIDQVTDERPEQKAVAWIYPPGNLGTKPVLQAVDLKGGVLPAVQNFIRESLPQDKTLRPVLIRIKECSVTESIIAPGRVEGKVTLSLSFDLMAEPENIHLTDYQLNSRYTRADNQQNVPSSLLGGSLNAALKYFDSWMNSQAAENPKQAKAVKVIFKDYHESMEGDTIYYAVNRPLTWADFQEKPRNSKFSATVFPSFGFDEDRKISNGIIKLTLSMKVYVPKSACWVKDGSRDDYNLNHEQRHFDLVAIVGKRFERKISAARISVNNCEGLINYEFYESFREMNHLQEQYDNETNHGANSSKQEEWNAYISKELVKLGIAKTAL